MFVLHYHHPSPSAPFLLGAEPQVSGLPCSFSDRQQGPHGQPAVPVRYLADRERPYLREDTGKGGSDNGVLGAR